MNGRKMIDNLDGKEHPLTKWMLEMADAHSSIGHMSTLEERLDGEQLGIFGTLHTNASSLRLETMISLLVKVVDECSGTVSNFTTKQTSISTVHVEVVVDLYR